MTQDGIKKERFFDAKNGAAFKITTMQVNKEEDSYLNECYQKLRDSIKEDVEIFIYRIWSPENPTNQIASYEEVEKILQETHYFLDWKNILLGLFNLLQFINALRMMDFTPASTAANLTANAIIPILMAVAEHKKAVSYLDDVMILTERINELEGGRDE